MILSILSEVNCIEGQEKRPFLQILRQRSTRKMMSKQFFFKSLNLRQRIFEAKEKNLNSKELKLN